MDDLEKKLKEFEHNLKERVKELGCLYAISEITEMLNISIEGVLKETLKIIPPAWQFPEITIARITYDEIEFKSEDFKETKWKIDTQIKINSTSLNVEVFYLEDKPFMDQELDLIKDIAVRLKNFIERKRMEQELKQAKKGLEKAQEELDDIDKKILRELFEDGKKGLKQFDLYKSKDKGKGKGMSHTGIKNRISNLIKSNVLKIQGNISVNQLNHHIAFLLLELRKFEQLKRFLEYYSKCKRVFFVLTVSGKYHLLIGIIGKSFEAINNFVSYCSLVNDIDVAKTKLIFGSNLELPEFLPINLFGKKQEDFNCERLCAECNYFKEGLCIGCE